MAYETNRYRIVVGSPPDRKDISVEIIVGHEQWAEVYDDPGHQMVEFFPRPSGEPWQLPLKDAVDLLQRAAGELTRRPRKEK